MDIRAGYYVEGKRVSAGPHQAMARARMLAARHTNYTVEVWHRLTDGAQGILAYTAYPPAWEAEAEAVIAARNTEAAA